MKAKIEDLASELPNGSPMEIGSAETVDEDTPKTQDKINLVGAWGKGRAELAEVTKTREPNPEIICWHCNKKGHPARRCPDKDKPPAGKGAGPVTTNNPKGGFKGDKGKGKGKGGKGTAYSIEDSRWQWHEEEYSSLGGSVHSLI